ncbi:MAG TPA: hypothetical protein DHW34_07085 [Actinobacteria bacterium]|nr:hypothetical protein [Actinomycetota bacterium]
MEYGSSHRRDTMLRMAADLPQTPAPAVVSEAPLPTAVRRPRDLLRLVITLLAAAAVLVFASLAATTASGAEIDLIGVVTGLPAALLRVVILLGGLGLLIIPVAVSIDLLVRRRVRQTITALGAAAVTGALALGLRLALVALQPPRVIEALTKVLPNGSRTLPLSAGIAAVVALLVVAQLGGRTRWQAASVLVIASVAASQVLASSLTLVAVAESILLGMAVGLAARYFIGTPTERPDGEAVAAALAAAGLVITSLHERTMATSSTSGLAAQPGLDRWYDARTADNGHQVLVHVLDRDQEGAGLATALWRQLRVIRPAARPVHLSLRRSLEHEAMVSMAAAACGAPVPRVRAVTEVGVYAAAIAYDFIPGHTLAELDAVDDADLRAVWSAVKVLHDGRIAHRTLTANNVVIASDGSAAITDFRAGDVAASDFALSVDTAEFLTTSAALVGARRAVKIAAEQMGPERVAAIAGLLQPLTLSDDARRTIPDYKALLKELRAAVAELVPDVEGPEPGIARFGIRTIVGTVGLAVAAYLLLPQLSTVDFVGLFRSAAPAWAALALVMSFLTYVGGTLSLIGFTPAKVRRLPALLAHFAATYYGLFAPGLVGTVGINTSFLQRSGVPTGAAIAAVGVTQVSAAIASVVMVLIFGALAGTGPEALLTPSEGIVLVVTVVITLALIVLAIPPLRRFAYERAQPLLASGLPRLVEVLQSPRALITGFGGNLLMNLAYILALVSCVRAYGGSASLAALALVFLIGSTLAATVPTPGGIGAVEVALTTSVTAAGVPAGVALSAVLLYRVVTFWIPVPIGWLSANWLSKRGLIFGPART